MTYTPTRIVTVQGNHLSESTDLSQSLLSFVGKKAYLVVVKSTQTHCLDIGSILTTIPNLDWTQSVATGLTPLLSDLFVERWENPSVPLLTQGGVYHHNLRVFDPLSYGDHQVHFTSVDEPESIDDPNRKGYLDDLCITSSGDMTNYLVAVNGVFHQTRYLDGVLYVLDGFRTVRLTGQKDMVVVDTQRLGGHSIIPLTTANVIKPNPGHDAVVTLPNAVTGKTLLLVVDGYLYHLDQKILTQMNPTHLKIHLNKLQLTQQFRHNPRTMYRIDTPSDPSSLSSRKYTDPFQNIFVGKRQVNAAVFQSMDFIYSRLTHFHSFLIVVNTSNLFTQRWDLVSENTPQLYTDPSHRSLSGMVSYGCGLCPSYLIHKDPTQSKMVLIGKGDGDVDLFTQGGNPPFIPSLIGEDIGGKTPVCLIDYCVA